MRISPALLMAPGRYRLVQWTIALATLLLAVTLGFCARELGRNAERSGLLLTLDGLEARLALISSSMAETVFLSRHGVNPETGPLSARSLDRLYRPVVSRLRFIDSVLVTRGSETLLHLRRDGGRVVSLPQETVPFAVEIVSRLALHRPAQPDAPDDSETLTVPQGFGSVHKGDGDLLWSPGPAEGRAKRVFASLRLPDDNDRPVVATFGVDLSGLDDPLRTTHGEEAGVIIFGYGETLVGALGPEGFTAPKDGLLQGVAGAAAEAFAASGRDYLEVVGFTWEGKSWLGVFDKLALIDRTSFVGYAAPRGKAQGSLGWGPDLLWALSGLSLVVGMAALLGLALVRRRMRAGLLTVGLDRPLTESDLLAVIRAGEREDVEFKSTLRVNLYSGKADKRIELACLKTIAAFLNSKGGVLLVGVEDTGAVLGTEADGFPSRDRLLLHFVNLFNQHIGAEHARFVSAQAVNVEDRLVLAVTCRKAETPVIVKSGDDEHYFVRVGPATNELSLSQVVALLRK